MANKWIQKSTQKMKAIGTTGAFSAQAEKAGLKVGGSIDNKLLPKAQKGRQTLLNKGCAKPTSRQRNRVQRQRAARRSGNASPVFNSRRRRR